MAVVHEYVPTSEKSGLYIRDGYDGTIVTYQVSPNAESLLRKMKYSDDDTLPHEIFTILHQLGLIYTHGSGVEPPDSLLDIELNSDDITEMKDTDREAMLSYLLSQAGLNLKEQREVQKYADQRGINVDNSDKSSNDSCHNKNGKNSSSNHQNDAQPSQTEKGQRIITKTKSLPIVTCDYCGKEVEAVDYIHHVRGQDGDHGDEGILPNRYNPDDANLVSEGDADIVYPDDLSAEYRYYTTCRWCGKRFNRLSAYGIHLQSNRASFDEVLHTRNQGHYSRPVLLPYREREAAVSKDRLTDLLTEEALSDIQFVANTEVQNSGMHMHRPAGDSQSTAKATNQSDSDPDEYSEEVTTTGNTNQSLNERDRTYEQNWLLTDLSRFYSLLLRTYDKDSVVYDTVATERNRISEIVEDTISKSDDERGSLREYKAVHNEPEVGVKVPRDLLQDVNAGDYRGEMYLPPGYLIPIKSIHDRLIQAWIEQKYPHHETGKTSSTIKSTNSSEFQETTQSDKISELDESSKVTNKDIKSTDHNQGEVTVNRSGEDGISDSDTIPLTTVVEVINIYRTHEDDEREASWFHANQILRDHVTTTTNIDGERIDKLLNDQED